MMEMRSRAESRWNAVLIVAVVLFMLTAWMVITDQSGVASAPMPPSAETPDLLDGGLLFQVNGSGGNIFAKYADIDGESDDKDHADWIDVLSMEWVVARDTGPATGSSRRRGAPIIDDLVLTYDYEKSTPKLVESLLKGMVIPTLEIEFTRGDATYIRYELKNVALTGYQIKGLADAGPPTVVVGNNFEEIKVTYTEYDDEGGSVGTVEYEWNVEKGE